ncbi:MAG: PEP-CTERM sorting domain-containing protein [Gammaproteobacteria bacterium]|nr:PEP-CTERM sorting domain-containing protein [Gammaproteobacteria bacterium]
MFINSFKSNFFSTCLLCFSLITISQAKATVIYDNTTNPIGGGTALNYALSADDFQLSQNTTVTGATIGLYGGGINLWDLSGEWAIFSNGPNQPGSILAIGLADNAQLVGTDYSFDFGDSVMLNANTTYWFGFHALNGGNNAGLAWQSRSSPIGSTSATISLSGGYTNPLIANYSNSSDWVLHSSFDIVFQLHGYTAVPEPSAIALFALGLLGLSFSRKHKA